MDYGQERYKRKKINKVNTPPITPTITGVLILLLELFITIYLLYNITKST